MVDGNDRQKRSDGGQKRSDGGQKRSDGGQKGSDGGQKGSSGGKVRHLWSPEGIADLLRQAETKLFHTGYIVYTTSWFKTIIHR